MSRRNKEPFPWVPFLGFMAIVLVTCWIAAPIIAFWLGFPIPAACATHLLC